ncbi:MAG: hypothetical protein ACOCXJ_04270 [Planctomycetota bacterium]
MRHLALALACCGLLVLGAAGSSAAAAEQPSAELPVLADTGPAAPSLEERAALDRAAAERPDDLATRQAGAFYEEPLFWGGVAALAILIILL